MSDDYRHELETARAIAVEAADLVKALRSGGKLVIDSKAGNEPVTNADYAANATRNAAVPGPNAMTPISRAQRRRRTRRTTPTTASSVSGQRTTT